MGLFASLFEQKGVDLRLENMTSVTSKVSSGVDFEVAFKNYSLKKSEECLLYDPIGQSGNFFLKVGFWGAFLNKKGFIRAWKM